MEKSQSRKWWRHRAGWKGRGGKTPGSVFMTFTIPRSSMEGRRASVPTQVSKLVHNGWWPLLWAGSWVTALGRDVTEQETMVHSCCSISKKQLGSTDVTKWVELKKEVIKISFFVPLNILILSFLQCFLKTPQTLSQQVTWSDHGRCYREKRLLQWPNFC